MITEISLHNQLANGCGPRSHRVGIITNEMCQTVSLQVLFFTLLVCKYWQSSIANRQCQYPRNLFRYVVSMYLWSSIAQSGSYYSGDFWCMQLASSCSPGSQRVDIVTQGICLGSWLASTCGPHSYRVNVITQGICLDTSLASTRDPRLHRLNTGLVQVASLASTSSR